ncbi:hypothetical protein Acr_28g0005210 [Actinidia rufa]|uniref:Leucine-rich repeat (LRR) family protein n=1 Tax=Actinidia rufa TaxID=165716 RepID=A0A7J0H9Q9_9ERIC|nr:hypothetical protein Acr_28g0005210 [Actinidia rufa]
MSKEIFLPTFHIILACLIISSLAQNTPPLPPTPAGQPLLIFADQRLAVVYPIIQKFKTTIVSDPLGITKTWAGSDVCKYEGFYCDNPPDNKSAVALASIDFNGFQLTAPTLNGFIDQLPDIALFHANSNYFSGTISSKISSLPYLYELDIRFLKEAIVLDVGCNRLTGPIPFSLGCLEKVEVLNFAGNLFYGMVPEVVCALGNLANLSLYCPDKATYTYIPCWLPHSSFPPLVLPAPSPS